MVSGPDRRETRHDLRPQNRQVPFRRPVADTAVNAEAEQRVPPRTCPVDDETVGVLDHVLVAVAGSA